MTITNVFCLGQKSTKARLLKISVSGIDEKAAILKNIKLRTKENPNDVRSLFIIPDLTPSEQ